MFHFSKLLLPEKAIHTYHCYHLGIRRLFAFDHAGETVGLEDAMVEKRTWKEFQDAGLLWWVNRLLHLFGWAIVLEIQDNGEISNVYPARVQFRGFDEKTESEGFIKLTKTLSQTMPDLLKEVNWDA